MFGINGISRGERSSASGGGGGSRRKVTIPTETRPSLWSDPPQTARKIADSFPTRGKASENVSVRWGKRPQSDHSDAKGYNVPGSNHLFRSDTMTARPDRRDF